MGSGMGMGMLDGGMGVQLYRVGVREENSRCNLSGNEYECHPLASA